MSCPFSFPAVDNEHGNDEEAANSSNELENESPNGGDEDHIDVSTRCI